MRRLAHWLAALYPAAWRARYGEEFHALLDDCPADRLDPGGILKGVLRMRVIAILQSPWKAAALFGAAIGSSALLLAALQPAAYRSEGVLDAPSPGHLGRAAASVLTIEKTTEIIRRNGLFPALAGYPAAGVNLFWRSVSITPEEGRPGGAARIGFTYPDSAKAQVVTRELQVAMLDAGQGLEAVSLAGLPRNPEPRTYLPFAAAGIAAGAVLGAIGQRVYRRFAPSF